MMDIGHDGLCTHGNVLINGCGLHSNDGRCSICRFDPKMKAEWESLDRWVVNTSCHMSTNFNMSRFACQIDLPMWMWNENMSKKTKPMDLGWVGAQDHQEVVRFGACPPRCHYRSIGLVGLHCIAWTWSWAKLMHLLVLQVQCQVLWKGSWNRIAIQLCVLSFKDQPLFDTSIAIMIWHFNQALIAIRTLWHSNHRPMAMDIV